MSYLIANCVISELVRPKPDAAVLDWFANTPDEALFLSVLTLDEIRKGVERLIISRGNPRAAKSCAVPAIDSLLGASSLHHDLRLGVTKMVCNSIAELFRDQMNPKRRACDSRNVGSGP